jgi:hypothetical protein
MLLNRVAQTLLRATLWTTSTPAQTRVSVDSLSEFHEGGSLRLGGVAGRHRLNSTDPWRPRRRPAQDGTAGRMWSETTSPRRTTETKGCAHRSHRNSATVSTATRSATSSRARLGLRTIGDRRPPRRYGDQWQVRCSLWQLTTRPPPASTDGWGSGSQLPVENRGFMFMWAGRTAAGGRQVAV